MSRQHDIKVEIGDLVLVMIGPPLGLWFSKKDRSMWDHGIVVDMNEQAKEKMYIVHVGGIIKKVSKMCLRPQI